MEDSLIKITIQEFIEQLDPEAAEELAWFGAKQVSDLQGSELGSDSFIDTYSSFSNALEYSSEHKVFLAIIALTTVEGLLEAGLLKLNPEWDYQACRNHILNIANVQYASLSYVLVSTKALNGGLLVSDALYKESREKSMEFRFKTPYMAK